MYYKFIINGYIICVRNNASDGIKISKEEYDQILFLIHNRPVPPFGYDYQLRADTLEWELIELPPEPEPEPTTEDKAEAYDILIGGTP